MRDEKENWKRIDKPTVSDARGQAFGASNIYMSIGSCVGIMHVSSNFCCTFSVSLKEKEEERFHCHTGIFMYTTSELRSQQILNHFPPGNPCRRPQSSPIQRTTKRVRIPKPQHGWDPSTCILERKTRRFHLVLFDFAAFQVVDGAGGVNLWCERGGAGRVGELGAVENVEVVVGGVASCVAFCTYCCACWGSRC